MNKKVLAIGFVAIFSAQTATSMIRIEDMSFASIKTNEQIDSSKAFVEKALEQACDILVRPMRKKYAKRRKLRQEIIHEKARIQKRIELAKYEAKNTVCRNKDGKITCFNELDHIQSFLKDTEKQFKALELELSLIEELLVESMMLPVELLPLDKDFFNRLNHWKDVDFTEWYKNKLHLIKFLSDKKQSRALGYYLEDLRITLQNAIDRIYKDCYPLYNGVRAKVDKKLGEAKAVRRLLYPLIEKHCWL